MEPKIVKISEIKTIGMKYHGNNQKEEIKALWGQFGPRMSGVPNLSHPPTAYGICDDFDQESKTFEYVAAIAVDEMTDLPEGMVAKSIPAGDYAVFECTLPTIMETYDYIIKKWLPESDFKRICGPDFEQYDSDFNPEDPKSAMHIYMPIEKK